MKKVSLMAFIAFACNGYAQSVIPPNLRASLTLQSLGNTITRNMDLGVYGIPLPEGEVEGNLYLDSEWRTTNILLFQEEKLITNVLTRLDVHHQGLEVKIGNEVRFIDNKLVKSFVWQSYHEKPEKYFINTRQFNRTEFGFLEVLVDGPKCLLKRTYTRVKKPDYNVALSVGSRNTKIIQFSSYYLLTNDKLIELPNSDAKKVEILKANGFTNSLRGKDIATESGLRLAFQKFSSSIK